MCCDGERLIAATIVLLMAACGSAAADRVAYTIAPSEADPSVGRFLHSSVVLFDRAALAGAPLLVFLPGTGGDPARVQLFLGTAVDAGYRAIGLSYDNEPEVMQVCARATDPACSENFRLSRLFGGGETPPEEAIVARLTGLLRFLAGHHPDEGWSGYLANGAPDWPRVAVAGHSQGGGMAALLAKRVMLARVVVLSGPVDYVLPGRETASWLVAPRTTPLDRWYGMYHREERLAPLLQRAYAALGLAADHIRVVDLPPSTFRVPASLDAYHGSIVVDWMAPRAADGSAAYIGGWRFLLGRGV